MRNHNGGGNGMVPHYSGTTLDAQARYAAGVKDILNRFFNQQEQDPANLIVHGGSYATKACKCFLFTYSDREHCSNGLYRRTTLKGRVMLVLVLGITCIKQTSFYGSVQIQVNKLFA